MEKDIVIIGAGLAGLTVAKSLVEQGLTVILLERYPTVGGRVSTFREHGLQYEIGAGRIFYKHTRVMDLIKKYKLHTYPIHSTITPFLDLFKPISSLLHNLPVSTLAKNTISDLVPMEYESIFKHYPYWAEINMLRADLALPLFQPNAPMGEFVKPYLGVKEGIDAITTHLYEDAAKAGVSVLTRYRVHDIKRKGELFEITGMCGKKIEETAFTYTAKRVIIATCRCSLSNFHVLKNAPVLQQVATSPLCRIYAVYPYYKGKVWFHDLKKTVNDGPLRYIIPINPETGLIMISYTDGEDTKVWAKLDDDALSSKIHEEVCKAFPKKQIPKPTFLKKHYWPSGCSYWLPGDYNVDKAIREAHNPSPNLFIVGESISSQQTWMEGALESADTLLHLPEFKNSMASIR